MDDLSFELRSLCKRSGNGSYATQADRLGTLALAARQLREAGFRNMGASSLKPKHVGALLNRWQQEGLSAGTLKNRVACLRWWAAQVGKAGVVPAGNTQLGIPGRRYITNENRAQQLGNRLERVTDPHVRISLALQEAFGLRREESIKFRPAYADHGDCIVLKGSWTKGGRPRTVPLTTQEQRTVLDRAHQLAAGGSLIPPQKTYIQQRHVYDGQCKAAALRHMDGLRHHYAHMRYEALTGWKPPAAGGPSAPMLTSIQRDQDATARQTISRELGHKRTQATTVYLGQ